MRYMEYVLYCSWVEYSLNSAFDLNVSFSDNLEFRISYSIDCPCPFRNHLIVVESWSVFRHVLGSSRVCVPFASFACLQTRCRYKCPFCFCCASLCLCCVGSVTMALSLRVSLVSFFGSAHISFMAWESTVSASRSVALHFGGVCCAIYRYLFCLVFLFVIGCCCCRELRCLMWSWLLPMIVVLVGNIVLPFLHLLILLWARLLCARLGWCLAMWFEMFYSSVADYIQSLRLCLHRSLVHRRL